MKKKGAQLFNQVRMKEFNKGKKIKKYIIAIEN